MTATKKAANSVAEVLVNFAKGNSDTAEAAKSQAMEIILSAVPTPAEAAETYQSICKEFLAKTIAVKGMPTRTISDGDSSAIVSSSGKGIADEFDKLLPRIKRRYTWCIDNYKAQSKKCFENQITQLSEMIEKFLNDIPPTVKERSSSISRIKKEIGYLGKWNQLFYTHKAMNFPSEVEYIFVMSDKPLAAVWKYSSLDEQCEYPPAVDHKPRDGRVYAVRGNWAEKEGLMKVGPDGYIDDIDRPHQEPGCMCRLQWIFAIRRLPEEMLTDQGRAQIAARTGEVPSPRPNRVNAPAVPAEPPAAAKGWFQRLFGKA
jgi:hypothetical protein